ncbi:hypothetical protein TYRP_015077 [Tyrophagus putrescentiae]|nr:hypothetical protein TYRP_015077 [Tyrophagus putrescentiae]
MNSLLHHLLLSPLLTGLAGYIHEGNRFYYRSIVKLHAHRRLTLNPLRNALENALLLLFAFRMLNLLLQPFPLLKEVHSREFALVDPIQWYILRHKEVYGIYFTVIAFVFPLYVLGLRYYFSSVPEQNMCWEFFFDIAVRNVDAFESCRIEDLEALEKIFKGKGREADVDREAVCRKRRCRLVENPRMSFELRAYLANLVTIFNQAAIGFLWTCNLAALTVIYFYIPPIVAAYQGSIADDNWPLWALVTAWSTLHAFIILHMINLLLGTGFVLTCCALLSATVNTRHMGHWNRLLHGEVAKRRRGNFIEPTPPTPVFSAFLERVFAEHIRLSVQVLRSNSDVFGQTVLVSLFANIPINIAFVARAVFRPLPPLDKTINSLFIVGQAVMLLAALVPLAFQGRRLHYAADIPRLQMILGGGGGEGGDGGDEEEEVSRVRKSHFLNLRLKLRLMNYYTRIHTKSFKYGITIGPTATLTPETICEILSYYAAFLFYVFELVFQHQLEL